MSWITDAISDYRAGKMDYPSLQRLLAERYYPPEPEDPELEGDNFSQDFSPVIQPGSWDEIKMALLRGDLTDAKYYPILNAQRAWVDANA